MSHVLPLLPPVAFLAVLVRFLIAPTWPGVAALGLVGLVMSLDGFRRGVLALAPRIEALEKATGDLPDIRNKLSQVVNRGR